MKEDRSFRRKKPNIYINNRCCSIRAHLFLSYHLIYVNWGNQWNCLFNYMEDLPTAIMFKADYDKLLNKFLRDDTPTVLIRGVNWSLHSGIHSGIRIRVFCFDPHPVFEIMSDPDPVFKIWSDSDPVSKYGWIQIGVSKYGLIQIGFQHIVGSGSCFQILRSDLVFKIWSEGQN